MHISGDRYNTGSEDHHHRLRLDSSDGNGFVFQKFQMTLSKDSIKGSNQKDN